MMLFIKFEFLFIIDVIPWFPAGAMQLQAVHGCAVGVALLGVVVGVWNRRWIESSKEDTNSYRLHWRQRRQEAAEEARQAVLGRLQLQGLMLTEGSIKQHLLASLRITVGKFSHTPKKFIEI